MTIELLYTSAAQGLKQGSRGFCTVVCTAGLPINLAQRLESLSGYRHLYQPGDQRADDNPVCHSHVRLAVGGKTLSILSRVGAYGVDYSQRTNKIAHHVVFDGAVPACGPAAVLSQAGIMRTDWDGECKTLQNGPHVPPLALQPAPCQEWQRITGDAGWAGVVANAWLQPAGKPVWIVFSESQSASLLDLMQEATAILPESRRWQATFSTYCTNLPPDVECRVRCVIAGSDEARMSIARGTVLDLTKPMGVALDNDAANAARHGFTIGATSNFVPSVPELPNVSDQNMEEIEAALSAHASDGSEYQLQPQIPGRLPIPLAMPNRRPGNNVNRKGSKSQNLQSKFWKVLALAASVLVFISLVGTGVFYFATMKNPLAGIVETTPKETPEQAMDKPEVNPQNEAVPIESSSTEASVAEIDSKGGQQADSASEIKLSLEQSLHEINENESIDNDRLIARLNPSPSQSSRITLSDVSKDFDFRDGKVYLRAKKDGYDYEANPELKGEISIDGKSTVFSVKVKNLDEPNLVVVISDEIGNPSATSVFEGTKLKADVDARSKDDDESKEIKRTFLWKGRHGFGEWTVFEKAQEVLITPQFTEVFCELTYATSIPSPETKVESEKITIQPLGTAQIAISSIFAGKDLKIKIEAAFPALPQKLKDQNYPYVWMKHDDYLDKNKLILDSVSKRTELFSLFFKPASDNDSNKMAIDWMNDAISQSKAVRDMVLQLKTSVKPLPNRGKVLAAFKKFVTGIVEAPTDEFFDSIEKLDEWIKGAVKLKKLKQLEMDLAAESKQQGKPVNKNDQDKVQAEWERLQEEFGRLFQKSQSLLADEEANVEIVKFAEVWDFDLANPNSGTVNQPRGDLTNLVKAIAELRETMNSSWKFEIVLESQKNIRIWGGVLKTGGEPGVAQKKKDEDAIYFHPFRVRTEVYFKDFKPQKRESTGNTPSDPKKSEDANPNHSLQTAPAKISPPPPGT